MEWQSILLSIIGIVLTALIGWLSEKLISYLNSKITNTKYAKYLEDAVELVTRAVKTTYQTYVESLKKQDAFTKENQLEALTNAKNVVVSQLSKDMRNYITDNFGDIDHWVSTMVESVIYDLKRTTKKEETA